MTQEKGEGRDLRTAKSGQRSGKNTFKRVSGRKTRKDEAQVKSQKVTIGKFPLVVTRETGGAND